MPFCQFTKIEPECHLTPTIRIKIRAIHAKCPVEFARGRILSVTRVRLTVIYPIRIVKTIDYPMRTPFGLTYNSRDSLSVQTSLPFPAGTAFTVHKKDAAF